jgi:hypothetical protein
MACKGSRVEIPSAPVIGNFRSPAVVPESTVSHNRYAAIAYATESNHTSLRPFAAQCRPTHAL